MKSVFLLPKLLLKTSPFAVFLLLLLPHLTWAQDEDDQDSDGTTSFQTFYDQLNDNGGQWIQTDDYGYVWQPPVQDPNWRPYSEGHWVDSDYGWTWVSDEPWGWATYHYGRWANLDDQGWVWVPGYRWAPAWVSWRYGGGYAGWAPLPPESFQGVDYARPGFSLNADFHIGGDADIAFHIGAGCYNFVPVEHLCEPRLHGYYVPNHNNYGVINHTTNITNVYVNKTVVNNYYNNSTHNQTTNNFGGVNTGGPNVATVNSLSRTHLQHVNLAESDRPGTTSQEGNTVHIFAPRINAASFHTAKPTHIDRTLSTVKVNRGDSIDHPQQVTATVKPTPPTQEQVRQAHLAQESAPSSARIATPQTAQKVHLSEPLTHFQTAADFHKTSTSASADHSTASSNNAGASHVSTPSNGATHSTEEKPASSGGNTPAVHDNNSTTHDANSSHSGNSAQESTSTGHDNSAPQHSSSTTSHATDSSSHPAEHHDVTQHPSTSPTSTHSSTSSNTGDSQHGSGNQGQHPGQDNNSPNGH